MRSNIELLKAAVERRNKNPAFFTCVKKAGFPFLPFILLHYVGMQNLKG